MHVDAKAPQDTHDLVNVLSKQCSNLYVLPPINAAWGDWSLVEIELQAIKLLLDLDLPWTHYIILSGQDFALANQQTIRGFLDRNLDQSFVNYIPRSIGQAFKHNLLYTENDGIVTAVAERTAPFQDLFPQITIYEGSQWKILNRECAIYSLYSEQAIALQAFYKDSFVPDESYFQTVLSYSSLAPMVQNNNMRYMIMEDYTNGQGVIRPRVLVTDDLINMMSSTALPVILMLR